MSEVDDAIASARASWSRISDDRTGAVIPRAPSRAKSRQTQAIGKRLTRIAVADVAILIAAMVIGWIVPLGIGGAMLVMALLVAATAVATTMAGVMAQGKAVRVEEPHRRSMLANGLDSAPPMGWVLSFDSKHRAPSFICPHFCSSRDLWCVV